MKSLKKRNKQTFQKERNKYVEAHKDFLAVAQIDPDDDPNNVELNYMDNTNKAILELNNMLSNLMVERKMARLQIGFLSFWVN